MEFSFYQVNAFTNEFLKGNKAGVCIIKEKLTLKQMQIIAREINLPETAFLSLTKLGGTLKWFTPCIEIPLCGHGTIATAHVLWKEGYIHKNKIIEFNTKSGIIKVRYLDNEWMEMEMPSFELYPANLPDELNSLFPCPIAVFYTNNRYLIELKSSKEVEQFQPDFEKLKKYRVVITARSESLEGIDFVSRYFGGPVGIPEDSVTGSAYCSLGPYWAAKLNKTQMVAYQASQRGGYIRMHLKNKKLFISGQAKLFFKGKIIFNHENELVIH